MESILRNCLSVVLSGLFRKKIISAFVIEFTIARFLILLIPDNSPLREFSRNNLVFEKG